MNLIDVHCHLTSEAFEADRDEVLDRAKQAGVTTIVCVGETFEDNLSVLSLSRASSQIRAALGHYPEYLDDAMADQTEALIRDHRREIVAIGEVGIDHWIAKTPEDRKQQHELFTRFVNLAKELDLPLSVHSRSAGHHALDLLGKCGPKRVCMHAFDGKAQYAQQAAKMGFFLSVPPSIVRSEQKRKLVAAVPLEHLLLETDSPVLGPDSQERNEPANLLVSARAIADIKGIELPTVLRVCTESTRRLFEL